VLFGSTLRPAVGNWDWVLDTVVVVNRRLDEPRGRALKVPYGSLVERAPGMASVKPYLGKKYETGTLFSFAPCKPSRTDAVVTFERPSIRELFPELTLVTTGEPPSLALAMTLTRCLPNTKIDKFWKHLTELVWDQGLQLGVQFEVPKIRVLGSPSEPSAPNCDGACSPKRPNAA
jgi:hypothetical protein